MTLLSACARAALFAYPADFRAQFGRQILADIDDDPSQGAAQLLDLLKGALSMRLDTLARDLSYAVRRLRSAPLFVAIVVLTFALGIGANIAVFSVLDSIVLKPLPFPNPQSLAIVDFHFGSQQTFPAVSLVDASDLRARSRTVAAIAAVAGVNPTLLVDGKPYTLDGMAVSPQFFSMLGITPQLGRTLNAADGSPGVYNVVISDELWHERLGGDPKVLGRTISLDGKPARVVGILRPKQAVIYPNNGGLAIGPYILTALPQRIDPKQRGARFNGAIVQLANGVSLSQANAEFELISQRLQKLYPRTNSKAHFSLQSVSGAVLGSTPAALWLLFAAVGGILLIACANVGNLLAARWSSRDREFAVRRALGASSRSIAGQLFVETGLLATLGALLGLAAAYGALRAIAPAISDTLPRGDTVGSDGWALLYGLAVLVAATLLAGLSPLLSLRSKDLQTALKSAGRGGDSSRRKGLRNALVVVEVAIALALVVTSTLTVRNLAALVSTPLGIRAAGLVVTDNISVPPETLHELAARLRALPGVESAALAMTYPLGGSAMEGDTPVAGRSYPPGDAPLAWNNPVSPGYFRTMGVTLLRGRDFTDADTKTSAPVIIVNQAYVDKYLEGTNPLGAHLLVPPGRRPATIVGVVSNERIVTSAITDPFTPETYQPTTQSPAPNVAGVVYAPSIAPATMKREVKDAFAAAMPSVQAPDAYTMDERVAAAVGPTQFATALLASLAAIALLLALAGVFGVVSFSVGQRSREFGVRIALGATSGSILRDVLRGALTTTGIGVVIGIAIAAFAVRAIAAQLNDISPFDPLTFAGVALLMLLCAALAALAPALRATRVEPAEALRYE